MKKRDYKYLTIIYLFILFYITYITKFFKFIYASKDTWYEIVNIIKDKSYIGPNMYNYYNIIYNPILRLYDLISFIPIHLYLIVSTILILFITIFIFYKLLRKHYTSEISFISTSIFILSSSIIYNTTHDITIIHYLLFLVLSLYGIELKRLSNHNWLLTISIFFMFITNFYLALPSTISIVIYYLINYFHNKNKINYKLFIKELFFLSFNILLGIFLSSRLTLPIIYLLLNKELTIPNISSNILYSINGLGITSILIISLINNLKLNKERIISTISLLLILYLFRNNTYYLLSFLPLYILCISNFLNDLKHNKLNYKYIFILTIIISLIVYSKSNRVIYLVDLYSILLIIFIYNKTKLKYLLYVPILLICISNMYINNLNNNLFLNYEYNHYTEIIDDINNTLRNNDKSEYNIYNELINDNKNIFDLILNNNKYLISRNNNNYNFKLLKSIEGINIYKLNSLPLVFLSNNIMSTEDFNTLNMLEQNEALLNVVVTDNISNNNYISHVQKLDIDLEKTFNNENIYIKNNKVYIKANEDIKLNIELPKKLLNKIFYISFDIEKNTNNNPIIVNNISSYNEIILSEEDINNIYISIYKGEYIIDNINVYYIDPSYIEILDNNIHRVNNIEIENHNIVINTLNLEKNNYIVFNLPYNKYYKLYINNEETPYELIDNNYLGTYLKKGTYKILLIYYGPLYYLSIISTVLSFIIYCCIVILELERRI